MKKYDVLTSGYVSMDRIINTLTPLRPGYTSLVENSDNAKVYYGGCSVNIACALAKLGYKAMPCIRVGEDCEELGFVKFLEECGVPTDALSVVENETTSNCYLIEDAEFNHVTIFYPGAMDGKYAAPMKSEFFENAGVGVITVASREDNIEFFKRCREVNLPLVFGMKADLDAFPHDFLWEILCYANILFTNESEKRTIEQEFGLADITELFCSGRAEVIVVTLGSDGSLCFEKTEEGFKQSRLPVMPCKNIVDATGSGDAYMSGYLYGYLQGRPPTECCAMGSVQASFVLEKAGCLTNLPTAEQFAQRFDKYKANREDV